MFIEREDNPKALVHVFKAKDFTAVTAWAESPERAEKERASFETDGAFFTKVFYEPGSGLGTYRIAAHYKPGIGAWGE